MSVVSLISGYFAGEKLESAGIVFVAGLHELYASDPNRFSADEGARIEAVVRSFAQYRLAYAGATLIALVFAEERAREYQHGLASAGAIPSLSEY